LTAAEKTFQIVLPRKGKNRHHDLVNFAETILEIQEKVDFKISSRGWCYQLEGFNIVSKDQFNRVQKLINECRKKGLLPIDFVAEEQSRKFSNIHKPEDSTIQEEIASWINMVLNTIKTVHKPDYWIGEVFYIQMLVEKVDLISLFEPICKEYFIPIANSKGWSSILQRAEMIERFKEMEKLGKIPVLLYCGDHDPFGLAISDYLMKNLKDLELGTGWSPKNLIIDRFGLNYDFIIANNLTWIDNLTSGSGKKADLKNPIVADYINKYGERKVEANAIIVKPAEARQLCEEAIRFYLDDALERFAEIKQVIIDKYEEIYEETGIAEPLQDALDQLNDWEEEE